MLSDNSTIANFIPFVNSNSSPVNSSQTQQTNQGSGPLLVKIGSNSAWGRKQKGHYRNCLSWMREQLGRGAQLFRVDLTTAKGGDSSKLREHFQELRRRVERVYGYKVDYFMLETREGNGVLHTIWGIEHYKAVWIPQRWLSEEWEKIHGAYIVYIKRVNVTSNSLRRVSTYLVSQYLAGQRGVVRVSWSWKRARVQVVKAWKFLYKEYRIRSREYTWMGMNKDTVTLTFRELLKAWDEVLFKGWCVLAGRLFFVRNRAIEEF